MSLNTVFEIQRFCSFLTALRSRNYTFVGGPATAADIQKIQRVRGCRSTSLSVMLYADKQRCCRLGHPNTIASTPTSVLLEQDTSRLRRSEYATIAATPLSVRLLTDDMSLSLSFGQPAATPASCDFWTAYHIELLQIRATARDRKQNRIRGLLTETQIQDC
jgi:hypothetical protein